LSAAPPPPLFFVARLGAVPLVAEDLGVITADVVELRGATTTCFFFTGPGAPPAGARTAACLVRAMEARGGVRVRPRGGCRRAAGTK
jgi:hypothetical protein